MEEISIGILTTASNSSFWRGYQYFLDKKVKTFNYDYFTVKGEVIGGRKNPYEVRIDINSPRKSSCNCAFAKDRRVVCKHMVALYFAAFSKRAKEFCRRQDELIEREEEMAERQEKAIEKFILSKSKQELVGMINEYIMDHRISECDSYRYSLEDAIYQDCEYDDNIFRDLEKIKEDLPKEFFEEK